MHYKILIFNQSSNDLWTLIDCMYMMLKIENVAFYAKSGLYYNK